MFHSLPFGKQSFTFNLLRSDGVTILMSSLSALLFAMLPSLAQGVPSDTPVDLIRPDSTRPDSTRPDPTRPNSTQLNSILPTLDPAISDAEQDETQTLVEPDSYTLGSGDRISIDVLSSARVFEAPIEQSVLVDGTLTIPWIGMVNVAGLTPLEAESLIVSAYSQYINNPRITFRLLQPRPIRISIAGEIDRTGSYTFPVHSSATDDFGNGEARSRYWPTLTDAISTAGGITRTADVRSVKILRAGQTVPMEANLWNLLQSGDLSQDPLLRDGDRISISAVETVNNAESITLAATTFSPTSIVVNVVGEVAAPGNISVPPNTPLNQAILAAGGFNTRAQSGKVDLVRLNPDGSVSQRSIPIDMTKGPNADENPVLQAGDTVVVARSGLAATSDTTSLIFSPLTNLLLSIFGNN